MALGAKTDTGDPKSTASAFDLTSKKLVFSQLYAETKYTLKRRTTSTFGAFIGGEGLDSSDISHTLYAALDPEHRSLRCALSAALSYRRDATPLLEHTGAGDF